MEPTSTTTAATLIDALLTLPHARYGPEYLGAVVYPLMARYVPADADVLEVGARPEDRGVLSRPIIPHRRFRTVDRDPRRGELVVDVTRDTIQADVILSTCVLHHTPWEEVPRLLSHLWAPLLMFTGPNVAVVPALFGDHRWHLDGVALTSWLLALGYSVETRRIGLTAPFSELFVRAWR